ncbi:MAG TPA: bifunctional DNA-formamidopyrimidine glycosylase/DNA-(apurinic or apyrimidinic site) lyase [Anaerolineaceae bacterium]
MPELPEVETIARFLREGGRGQASILSAQVERVHLLWPGTLATPLAPAELQARLAGQVIEGIGRRGKFLRLELNRDTVLFHLRMSGDLLVGPAKEAETAHVRFSMDFSDRRRLAFDDTRKFGRVWITSDPEQVTAGLGPEPLGSEFTPVWLYAELRARRRQVKPLLLDQGFIAGLGNIYTDEALHRARIHPLRLSSSIHAEEAEALWQAIRETLLEGIDRQGASIDWVYRGGEFQNYFRAYQRTGEPCPRCGTPITRILVGQRGTHYCPACQVLLP